MAEQLYKMVNGSLVPVSTSQNYSQPQTQQLVKKSGAVYSVIKNRNGGNSKFEGNTIVNAWRMTKFGMMTATVAPYAGEGKKGLEIVNSNGKNGSTPKEYQKMIYQQLKYHFQLTEFTIQFLMKLNLVELNLI